MLLQTAAGPPPLSPGDRAQLSPAGWLLPGAHTIYFLLGSIPWPQSASGANQTHSTWNLNVHHHKHLFPFLKRQRKQLSFYFQGATAAGTKENRGGNIFLKPFPKTFAWSVCWLMDHVHTLEQISGISHLWSSQESNISLPIFLSINYLPADYRNIRNPMVHNS